MHAATLIIMIFKNSRGLEVERFLSHGRNAKHLVNSFMEFYAKSAELITNIGRSFIIQGKNGVNRLNSVQRATDLRKKIIHKNK